MSRSTLAILAILALLNSASAQQMIDGKGRTCSETSQRCYALGGNAGICEPKFQQCLQTGTFFGNNNTITNLKKR